MTLHANVFFDFLLQKSLAGTLPATLAPFADRFTRQTADLANAHMRPFCMLSDFSLGLIVCAFPLSVYQLSPLLGAYGHCIGRD